MLPWCSHIQLPETAYPLFDSLPAFIVDTGKLSQLQLEGVLYACTKHQELLPSGHSESLLSQPLPFPGTAADSVPYHSSEFQKLLFLSMLFVRS